MKKRSNSEMQPDYDSSAVARGKYARRHTQRPTPKKVSATVKQTMKDYRKTLSKLA